MANLMRRARTGLIAVLATALAFTFVPAGAAYASGPGSAALTVTRGGEPAPNVSVFLNGPDGFAFGFSGSTGVIELTDLALGTYTGSTSGNFEDQPTPVSFTLTEATPSYVGTVEIVPWPSGTGSVVGEVTDAATGLPLEGVSVGFGQILPGAGRSFPTQYTAADGAFAYEDLPAGTYSVSTYLAGYFNVMSQTVELADGEDAVVSLALVAQDAAITGRVVDGAGLGVEGVTVAAIAGQNSGASVTDVDGFYTILDIGAGVWTVTLGGNGWPWANSSVDVTVGAGETATAPDLTAIPRTTGSLSGLVAGSDQAPETAGLADICVQIVETDGDPVGSPLVTTSDGSFYFDAVAPGDYTIRFDDCAATRVPPYATAFLGGSPTIAGATVVTVEALADLWLDYTFLEPQEGNAEPDHPAVPVAKKKLKKGTKNLIDAPSQIHRGATFEIEVGLAHAGEWVSVWVYSAPLQLGGWHQVAADGTVEVTLPVATPLDRHRLSVQDADDDVIGWTWIDVKKVKKH